jgi:Tol biopolymer transport system component
VQDGAGRQDGVAERVVAVAALAAILFIALAMTGTLPLPGPGGAGATQYCTQYQYNQGCEPLVPPLIAFSSNRDAGGNTEVYVMNADGSAQTRIFSNTNIFDGQPSWRPDGQKLAFTSLRDGNAEIYSMNVDGSGVARLTANTATDDDPAWSPDSSKIAFESFRDGNAEIYVMNPDGTGPTRLTNNTATDTQPAWSPDGSKIAFVSSRSGKLQIWLMNPDGSGQTRLTLDSANDTAPAWSPDGKQLAFVSDAGGVNHIWMINADGTNQTQLTNGSTADSSPTWSPDGTKIAFTRVSLNNLNVMVMNADGSGVTHLTNDFAVDATPRWQPGPPGAPTGVSATAAAGKATITYTPPVQLGGAEIVRYTATASPGGAQGFSTGGPIVVHGLTNGQTYTFVVNASNQAGTGPPSDPSNAVTPEPLELTATYLNSNNSVYVPGTWTNMSVTVTFFCTDVGGPGVASVTAPVTVSVEGTHTVDGLCTDNDGKTASLAAGPIMIDKTIPLLTATTTNADGSPYTPGTWTGQPVTVTYTCVDSLSGVASVSAPFVDNLPGVLTPTGFCTDNAGNVASLTTGRIMVDLNAPFVLASFRNADGSVYVPGTNSWTNQSVTATFNCTDPGGSGVVSFSAPITLTGQGLNQSVTGFCVDAVGHIGSSTFRNINIDKTAPSLLPILRLANGLPYTPGTWTNQNVIVSFQCTDAGGSGVRSFTAPITFSADTAGGDFQYTGFCTDIAGNVGSVSGGGIMIDKLPPMLSASFTNADGSTYTPGTWTNQAVTITFNCVDSLSGVSFVTPPQTYSFDIDGLFPSGECRDAAGNESFNAFGPIRIDRTPPGLFAQFSNADGSSYQLGTWTHQAVTVAFSCSDGGSGVASVSSPVILASDGAGQTASGFCIDVAGNVTNETFGPIDIDVTPPSLTATFTNADGSPYTPGTWTRQTVTVTFACTDAVSGVASFSAPVTISSEGAGQTAHGSCTDNAGNVTAKDFGPINIDMTPPEAVVAFDPATNTVVLTGTDKGGSGIPAGPVTPEPATPPRTQVRYTLTDGAGNTTVLLVKLDQHNNDAHVQFVSFSYNGAAATAAPANDLHYNWDTKKDGTLKNLTQDLTLGSGKNQQHVVATYNGSKDQTTIKVDPGGQNTKQPGLVIVAVVTSQGTLAFSY